MRRKITAEFQVLRRMRSEDLTTQYTHFDQVQPAPEPDPSVTRKSHV